MARDRLAAMRAQQGNVSTNSYPTQASGESRRPNPYAQQDDRSYEMADVRSSKTHLASSTPPPGDMPAFYAAISSIQDDLRTFNDNVARIDDLHSRSLNNMDDAEAQRNAAQLDELAENTRALTATLKNRIKVLEAQKGPGRDGQIRQQQVALVKSKFMEAIQNYQRVEQQHRMRYRQRVERQYMIVNPNATPDEVKKAVADDEQGGQIFSQALMHSRHAESREAFRLVEERRIDIDRIQKTLAELAQAFNDMSAQVELQDDGFKDILVHAAAAEADTEAAVHDTNKAVISARAARKKRWICFIIILVVLAVAAIIIGILVARSRNNSSS